MLIMFSWELQRRLAGAGVDVFMAHPAWLRRAALTDQRILDRSAPPLPRQRRQLARAGRWALAIPRPASPPGIARTALESNLDTGRYWGAAAVYLGAKLIGVAVEKGASNLLRRT
jgi:NAD(P)-dependent dehydrogenase (short-subunit alcohol dehydrogenase family)